MRSSAAGVVCGGLPTCGLMVAAGDGGCA